MVMCAAAPVKTARGDGQVHPRIGCAWATAQHNVPGDQMTTPHTHPWHDDDAFWDAMHPVFFRWRHWHAAPDEVEALIHLLDLKPGILYGCDGIVRYAPPFGLD